jgi:hypothetical protein
VNRQAPDLSVIPSYFKHVDRFGWYFGTLEQRWTYGPWRTVVGRVVREIAATAWWAPVPFGLLALGRMRTYGGFAVAWSAGAAAYVAIFLGLNEMHNYYQIPLIAPFCLWLAVPIYGCWTASSGPLARYGRPAGAILLAGYAGSSMVVAAQRFYQTDPVHVAVGEFVRTSTHDDDLIVMSYCETEHADPSYLFYARRYGWSVGHGELSLPILEALRRQGATAVVTSTLWPPGEETRRYLTGRPVVGTLRLGEGTVSIHRLGSVPGHP